MLELPLVLTYINGLPNDTTTSCKIFAENLIVGDIKNSVNKFKIDLEKISYEKCQWKMKFNLDPGKQSSLENQAQIISSTMPN